MANIVVTTVDANHIKVDFGDYHPEQTRICIGYYNRATIEKVEQNADFVRVHVLDGGVDWYLSHDGYTGTFEVDSIDGVSIISNSQLATLVAALMKV